MKEIGQQMRGIRVHLVRAFNFPVSVYFLRLLPALAGGDTLSEDSSSESSTSSPRLRFLAEAVAADVLALRAGTLEGVLELPFDGLEGVLEPLARVAVDSSTSLASIAGFGTIIAGAPQA
jgi:hypothetical protein